VTREAPQLCRRQRAEIIRGRLRETLREAMSSGLPSEDIRKLVDDELAHVNGQRRSRE
jgi:hypothetical protein